MKILPLAAIALGIWCIIWLGMSFYDTPVKTEVSQVEASETMEPIIASEATPVVPTESQILAADMDERDVEFVCRATIAELMGRPINIVRVREHVNGVVKTSYRRSSDNSVWENACKIDADRVVWASIENNRTGRWRDGSRDEIVRFELFATRVVISQEFADGSSMSDSFDRQ